MFHVSMTNQKRSAFDIFQIGKNNIKPRFYSTSTWQNINILFAPDDFELGNGNILRYIEFNDTIAR